jgi:hypothetical protein
MSLQFYRVMELFLSFQGRNYLFDLVITENREIMLSWLLSC